MVLCFLPTMSSFCIRSLKINLSGLLLTFAFVVSLVRFVGPLFDKACNVWT